MLDATSHLSPYLSQGVVSPRQCIAAMLDHVKSSFHWRWGERYFMQKLIDGDLAANNGGWQWSASTGTDAAPYFRIMNPTLQSERYDPQGQFIKKYCPELRGLKSPIIHNPYARGIKAGELDYPLPIVNYQQKRQEALQIFAQ